MSTAAAQDQGAPSGAPRQDTPAMRQKARLDAFMDALGKRADNLSTLLSDSGVDPARFLAVARRALMLTPDLLNCSTDSLLTAFFNAATDGLLPDGRQGAIVIYKRRNSDKKDAQWQPMYQGLLKVAYESGNFTSIEARVVYEGDDFDYDFGDEGFIQHKPARRRVGEKPPITHSYAIAKTTNGGIFREVFEEDDIAKVKAVSRATNGPGKDWPEEMARKGPLRRLWKFLPRSPAMDRIVDHDDENYDLTQLGDAANDTPARRLEPGFAAITHQPAEAMPMVQVDDEDEDDPDPAARAAAALGDDDLPEGLRAQPSVLSPTAWAEDFERRLPSFKTVKDLSDAWQESRQAGHTREYQRLDPDGFDALVQAKDDRIDAISGWGRR